MFGATKMTSPGHLWNKDMFFWKASMQFEQDFNCLWKIIQQNCLLNWLPSFTWFWRIFWSRFLFEEFVWHFLQFLSIMTWICVCRGVISCYYVLSPGLRIWSRRPSWTMTSWRTWSCRRSKRSWTACTLWSMERTAVSLRRAMWDRWSTLWKVKNTGTGVKCCRESRITIGSIQIHMDVRCNWFVELFVRSFKSTVMTVMKRKWKGIIDEFLKGNELKLKPSTLCDAVWFTHVMSLYCMMIPWAHSESFLAVLFQ